MLKPVKAFIKSILESVRRGQSAKKLEQTERHVTREQLTADLLKMGVQPDDTLFIHSSLKSLGFVKGGVAEVIAAMQDAVGDEGTLLLPTYYMPGGTIQGTCELQDYVFDPSKHGTNMGRLPEAFLQTPGVHRSVHPTHSVSAWGKHAKHLTDAHHKAPSVFGIGSPWQRFLALPNAKVLGLGITMGPVTFYHLLEDTLGDAFPVAVWGERTYQLSCVDHDGKPCSVPVRPYKPELSSQRIDHRGREDLQNFFKQEFESAGLRVNGRVGEADSWFIPAQGFFEHLKKLAGENITIYSGVQEIIAHGNSKV